MAQRFGCSVLHNLVALDKGLSVRISVPLDICIEQCCGNVLLHLPYLLFGPAPLSLMYAHSLLVYIWISTYGYTFTCELCHVRNVGLYVFHALII